MPIDNLKEKIKPGDIDTASKMVGISTANGYKAIEREESKHHESMIKALTIIVEQREQLIEKGL
ncbi:hypothetical protein ACFS5N_16465 [Mucilaginibacter ximonensis]|uniref:Uncharacterized protein n=1 Tax=Mucilaginibacter ximonensis TaxID=538021 RepID=A0ABW5YFD7_9SPHI